jgi:hypothetical protein
MTKHLAPPFKMKVEDGRLVPATAYDQERLDSFRRGSTVSVRLTADRMRPLERKYRAVIGRVVKTCETPWSNAESAHQALKLACGYVNYSKTVGGSFMHWPRSISDFDDAELQDYYEQVLALLQKMTGVDPETLQREAPDAGDDDEAALKTAEISGEAAIDQKPAPTPQGADDSAEPRSAATAEEAGAASPPAPASDLKSQLVGSLKAECIDKMLRLAGDAALTPEQRAESLDMAGGWWRDFLPKDHEFVRAVVSSALKVSCGEITAAKARVYLEGLA